MTGLAAATHPAGYWAIALAVVLVIGVVTVMARTIGRSRRELRRLLTDRENLLQVAQRRDAELLARQERLQAQEVELQTQREASSFANQALLSQGELLRVCQQRLEAQRAELERAHSQLDAHAHRLASLSHEVRMPLNRAMILSKLLADNERGNLTPEQVKFAQSIHAAGHDVLELIHETPDLSGADVPPPDVRKPVGASDHQARQS